MYATTVKIQVPMVVISPKLLELRTKEGYTVTRRICDRDEMGFLGIAAVPPIVSATTQEINSFNRPL